MPEIRGSYWTSEPIGFQVNVKIVDLTTQDAAVQYWEAAPLPTTCLTAGVTGSSIDDAPLERRAVRADVLAFTSDDLTGWYSVIGPDGLVATLNIDAPDALDAAIVDDLIDRTRRILAGERIAAG